MEPEDRPPPDEFPATPLVVLAALVFLAGAAGMAISFAFLPSDNHLDVIAGAVGFLAGVILVAAGLLSLAVQSQSPSTSQAAIHAAGCLTGFLPPAFAALTWPTLYLISIFAVLLMPLVLIACITWSWYQSRSVAGHLAALTGWRWVRLIRAAVFVAQSAAVLGTWPLFGYFLRMLESMGHKIGWS
ncbi:hypothetical protein [Fimbriiglobus ruber]|uniref:Uncharacterized protein n=1 Tax=Fimbriiglobus ruber TaxID=1908690 RepID=A0A225DUN6_9BACT|nr:hypothetical protein [Fimbriiglobus ruber]OWK40849.1 hypothetical protein FRUB_04741 [Fimbriiglobus ruber]